MATFLLASFAHADKIDRCLGICQSLTQTLHYLIPGFLISSHCYGFGLWNLVSWPYMATVSLYEGERREIYICRVLFQNSKWLEKLQMGPCFVKLMDCLSPWQIVRVYHLLTVGKTRPMMHEKATLPTNVGLERILLQNYVKSGCRETLQEDKRSVK